LKYAIRSDDPVIFLEHKLLYRQKIANSLVSRKKFFLPFKQAKIRKHGIHLTIVSYGYLIYKTLNAAANIERKHNISIEVIDLVSLKPIDWKTLFFSVKKTNRCLIVHEDNKFMGLGAEIAAEINNNCFVFLDAPIMRHAGLNVHIPYNNILEEHVLPQVASIEKAIENIISF
jgi:2-oxoisovalerate dehydrogenase E1 component